MYYHEERSYKKALEIAENMMLHGPGYVFKGSQELAIKALDKDYSSQQNRTLSFKKP